MNEQTSTGELPATSPAPGSPEEQHMRDNARYIAPDAKTLLAGVLSLLFGVAVTLVLVITPVFAVAHVWGWVLRSRRVLTYTVTVAHHSRTQQWTAALTVTTWWIWPAIAGRVTFVVSKADTWSTLGGSIALARSAAETEIVINPMTMITPTEGGAPKLGSGQVVCPWYLHPAGADRNRARQHDPGVQARLVDGRAVGRACLPGGSSSLPGGLHPGTALRQRGVRRLPGAGSVFGQAGHAGFGHRSGSPFGGEGRRNEVRGKERL